MSFPSPLVSICCLTYNHTPFIRKCLDGFLMQKTDFPIEILIHDDASTDGTDDIIREYTAKYPDLIFPLFETENQYSKGHAGEMDIKYNYSRARGKYIAYCEGDDYWTEPLKLQKQVDFLEEHPEYSVCFHRCRSFYVKEDRWDDDACGKIISNNTVGVDISLDTYFNGWYTQPLTMVFRRSAYDMNWCKRYVSYRDMHEIYHLLKAGKGYLFAFCGGVYQRHNGGIAGLISEKEYCRKSLIMDGDFYNKTKEKGPKKIFCETLQTSVNAFAKDDKWLALKCAFKHYILSKKYKTLIKNIKNILKAK